MSRRGDGRYYCDRDGTPLTNGGAHECAIVTRLNPETGEPEVYHFCYENGCDRKVLSARNLADYERSNGS